MPPVITLGDSLLDSVAASLSIPPNQIIYVDKTGSDTLGNGSIARPFLTIAAAQAAITDASSSKPYLIKLGPGTYNESPTWKPQAFKHLFGVYNGITIVKHSDNSAIVYEGGIDGGAFNAYFLSFSNGLQQIGNPDSILLTSMNLFFVNVGGALTLTGPSTRPIITNPPANTSRASLQESFNAFMCNFGAINNRGVIAQFRYCNITGVITMNSRNTTGGTPALEGLFPENFDFSSAGPHRLVLTIGATGSRTYTYTSTLTSSSVTADQLIADMNNVANWVASSGSVAKPVIASKNAMTSTFGGFPFKNCMYLEVDTTQTGLSTPVSITVAAGTTAVLAGTVTGGVGFAGTGTSGTNQNNQVIIFASSYRSPTLNDLSFFQAQTSNVTSGNAVVSGNSKIQFDVYGQIAPAPSFVAPATDANNLSYITFARWLGYTPTTSGDWTGTIRQTGEALDQAASRIKALETGSVSAEGDLGTVTWSDQGPTTINSKKFRWSRNGKLVTAQFYIKHSADTWSTDRASWDIPAGMPTPAQWTSQANGTVIAIGDCEWKWLGMTLGTFRSPDKEDKFLLVKDESGDLKFLFLPLGNTEGSQETELSCSIQYFTT